MSYPPAAPQNYRLCRCHNAMVITTDNPNTRLCTKKLREIPLSETYFPEVPGSAGDGKTRAAGGS